MTPIERPAAGPGDRRQPGHDLIALAIGAVALILLVASPWLVDRSGPEPFYKGPLIFPLIALAITVAGALPAAARALRSGLGTRIDAQGFPRRGAALFAAMCLYPPAIGVIGLQLATFCAMYGGLILVGRRGLQALAIALGVTVCIHLAFRTFLDVWFPTPWLMTLLGD